MRIENVEVGVIRTCVGYSLLHLPPAYAGHCEIIETRAWSDGTVEYRKHYGGYQEHKNWTLQYV